MAYHNADGLYLKYGTEKATATNGGEYRTNGNFHEVELEVSLASLTETETILNDVITLPTGARIQQVDVVTITAAATGVAIDVGTIAANRSTEGDYNGLLAAFPTASMDAAGEVNEVVIGHTYVGALVGTTLAAPAYISASRTTATAFTAGLLRITVKYFIP